MTEFITIKQHPKYKININGEVMRKFPKSGVVHKLKTQLCKRTGYRSVCLGGPRVKVHRLLALTFIDNPKNLPCVDHIDRNRDNNDIMNLRWVSWRGNSLNSTHYLNRQGYICQTNDCYITKEGLKTAKGFRAYYSYNSKSISKRSKNREVCENWLKEMKEKYKDVVYNFDE